ncbi:MAG TPA: hypothetical protein VGX76_09405 [Pirellulales bacterium]|nr:hypothetical protein [Pirellulales bacterium]
MSADTKAAPAKTADQICRSFPLSEAAAELLRDKMEPRPFLDLLIEKKHYPDAVRFLAHSMPKRETIWWACLCSRPETGAVVPAPVVAAQKAAEDWVAAPSDDKRRAAHVAAQAAGVGTPSGLTCEAVFFSEGSLGPAEFQAVPAPEHVAATTAANAIIIAAVAVPAKMAAKYGQFLALGKDVAAGKNRWK